MRAARAIFRPLPAIVDAPAAAAKVAGDGARRRDGGF